MPEFIKNRARSSETMPIGARDEPVMADAPRAAAAETEHLRAGDQEHAPALAPQVCVLAIDAPQERIDLSAVAVEIFEPLQSCALVMCAAPAPFGGYIKDIGKLPD